MHTFFRSIVYTLFLIVPVLGLIVALISAYFEVQVIAELLDRFWIALLLVLVLELIKVTLVLSMVVVDDRLTSWLKGGFRALQVVLLTVSFIASCALLAKAFDKQDGPRTEALQIIDQDAEADMLGFKARIARELDILDAELARQRTIRYLDGRYIGPAYREVEEKRQDLLAYEAEYVAMLRDKHKTRREAAYEASYLSDIRAQHPVVAPVLHLFNEVFGTGIRFSTVSFFLAVLLSLTMELCILVALSFFGQSNKEVLQLLFEQLRVTSSIPPEPATNHRQKGRQHRGTDRQSSADRAPKPSRTYTLKKIY